jgi:hypothetical protein
MPHTCGYDGKVNGRPAVFQQTVVTISTYCKRIGPFENAI